MKRSKHPRNDESRLISSNCELLALCSAAIAARYVPSKWIRRLTMSMNMSYLFHSCCLHALMLNNIVIWSSWIFLVNHWSSHVDNFGFCMFALKCPVSIEHQSKTKNKIRKKRFNMITLSIAFIPFGHNKQMKQLCLVLIWTFSFGLSRCVWMIEPSKGKV